MYQQDRIAFVTLGCAKNEVDSDKMRARVLAAGFEVVTDPACADAVIVNTCSFITEATEEAISTILDLLDLPRLADGTARLVVAGCMPARYGDTLADELPEVAAFVSCAEEDEIVGILEKVLGQGEQFPSLGGVPPQGVGWFVTGGRGRAGTGGRGNCPTGVRGTVAPSPSRTVTAPWAYVKIADGCNRLCSFCTIPYIRGRYRSVPAPEIVAEVAELVDGGVREIVLIAQDTGLWGQGDGATVPLLHENLSDEHVTHGQSGTVAPSPCPTSSPCPAPSNLAGLLDLLATRFSETWFRVMYLQPQGITSELLSVMARHDNICDYLDIPLQHASARVLAEMNRSGNSAEYLALLSRIRAALPDVTLRTTVIAGFPGETRADARELERFIEEAAFDYVGVFAYSQEDGTVAGTRTDQVPLRTRRARAQRLRDLADTIGFAKIAARTGSTEEVLVTEYDEDVVDDADVGDGGAAADVGADATDAAAAGARGAAPSPYVYPLLGRTKRQAPEVDGVVHLDRGAPGELLSVTMVEAYCYELDGRVIGTQDV